MNKVLIVEDDRFLANAYKVGFEGEEFDVSIAYDGEEALKSVREFAPDIILLDIMIPKIDGFEVLKKLKADKDYKKIPIIIASNLGQKKDIDRGLELGAEDYIIKSESSIIEILEKIRMQLK